MDTTKMIEVGLWVIILTAIVIWGQSFRKKTRNLMGNRRYFYYVSATLVVVCLGGMLLRGVQLGLDFTGGSLIELSSPQMVTVTQVREAMADPRVDGQSPGSVPIADLQVQVSASLIPGLGKDEQPAQKIILRMKRQGNEEPALSADQTQMVVTVLAEKLQTTLLREERIGSTITGELQMNAITALVITLGLQLIYIYFRFGGQMRFGLAADIALVHDVIIMLGIYALAGRQVDSPFIAALLTVTGYSVMDSVVIFDRIRENLRTTKNATFSEVVNLSVNQTMTRSINTTLTPILTLLAIYFFGGSTLQNFAFALLVGIFAGAYSSICLASPLLIEIDHYATRKEKERLAMRRELAEQKAGERKKREVTVRPEELDPVEKAMQGAASGKRRGRRRR